MSGSVVWFTGLPASGKTTLARAVHERLRHDGRACLLLDSDEMRERIVPHLGYDEHGRGEFYELLARLAAWLAEDGQIVLVAATANRQSYRSRARTLAANYREVFVDTPREECERRDPKGLYRAARARDDNHLPGGGVQYEPPPRPDATARGGRDEHTVEQIAHWFAHEGTTVPPAQPPAGQQRLPLETP